MKSITNGTLSLTRKPGQQIYINNNISITVTSVRGKQVRLTINAPKNIPIMRDETIQKIMRTIADVNKCDIGYCSHNDLMNTRS